MEIDKQNDYAMEEYKILWDYYKVTLEERRYIFEWYFKAVALPASIIGFLLTQDSSSDHFSRYNLYLGVILVAIFLCGVTLYVTYVSESVNATKYFRSITRIRQYFQEHGSSLINVFKVDHDNDHKMNMHGRDVVKIFKGLTIPIINSAIALIPISLFLPMKSLYLVLIVYFCIILLHLTLYFLIYRFAKKS